MSKKRLGKRERAERKAQWDLVKSAKSALIADNLANLKSLPTSKGYRSVNVLEGYAFHIHWNGMGTGRKGKVVRGKFVAKF